MNDKVPQWMLDFEEAYGKTAYHMEEQLQIEIDQLREENTRIVAESKQCHARNDEMCHEHFLLKAELELTRNAVKLVIGRDNGKPWTEVPDSDVDGYVDFIKYLKNQNLLLMF